MRVTRRIRRTITRRASTLGIGAVLAAALTFVVPLNVLTQSAGAAVTTTTLPALQIALSPPAEVVYGQSPGAVVYGRATIAGTSTPVSGVTIHFLLGTTSSGPVARTLEPPTGQPPVTTDINGGFRTPVWAPARTWWVWVTGAKTGYTPVTRSGSVLQKVALGQNALIKGQIAASSPPGATFQATSQVFPTSVGSGIPVLWEISTDKIIWYPGIRTVTGANALAVISGVAPARAATYYYRFIIGPAPTFYGSASRTLSLTVR